MNRAVAGLLICDLAGGCIAAEENGFRMFTDIQGRSIEARIVEYDSVKGKLQIERHDGKKSWVRPDVFAAENQDYIKDWIDADLILSERSLRISMKKQAMGKTGSKKENKVSEKVCFEVTLDNRTEVPITGLKMEYHYFVKTLGSGTRKDSEKTVPGALNVASLAPKERKQFNTNIVYLDTVYHTVTEYSRYSNNPLVSLNKVSEDELTGIWIRIYGPAVDGVSSVRDVCYPTDLKEKVRWE